MSTTWPCRRAAIRRIFGRRLNWWRHGHDSTCIGTKKILDRKPEVCRESDKESKKGITKESDKEETKEPDKKTIKDSTKDLTKISDKESDRESNKETIKKSIKDSTKESDKETNKESNKETNKETNKEPTKKASIKEPIKEIPIESTNLLLTLDALTKNLDELKNIDNLDTIVKMQHDMQQKIKDASLYLDNLKNKLNRPTLDIQTSITDLEYKNILNEITLMKSNENDNVEKQIDKYLEMRWKVMLCKNYLEMKKLEIIEIK